MSDGSPGEHQFVAPFTLEYTYKRSLGPLLSRFYTGLRDRQILGARAPDGRVLMPPSEYDPETGATIDALVPVGPGGTVTSWCWVDSPSAYHPLEQPFAFALVQLDGADTALLHAVDGPEASLRTGLRVRPRWREERVGSILDIACFEVSDE